MISNSDSNVSRITVERHAMYLVARDHGHEWYAQNPHATESDLNDELLRELRATPKWRKYSGMMEVQARLATERVLEVASQNK